MTMSPAPPMEPQKIYVNGVELHYIDCGTGEPVVLVHGGVGDYRS
jgi:pimeloyl-ACP methyl ester carboxylesterase